MPILDCSCRGINPDCEKCEGKGYYKTEELLNSPKKSYSKKGFIISPHVNFESEILTYSSHKIEKLIFYYYEMLISKQENLKSINSNNPIPKKISIFSKKSSTNIYERKKQIQKNEREHNSLTLEILHIKAKLEILFKRAETLNIKLDMDKYPKYLENQ